MRSLGTLLLSGFVVGLVWSTAVVVANGAGAVSLSPSTAAPVPTLQHIARKGTRNHVPGDDTLTVPTETKVPDRNSVEECMAIWDAATHITKTKWREICRRQVNERSAAHTDAP